MICSVLVVAASFGGDAWQVRSDLIHRRIKNNHGVAVYIINSKGIAYHQHEVLHLIIVKANTAFGDDIHAKA